MDGFQIDQLGGGGTTLFDSSFLESIPSPLPFAIHPSSKMPIANGASAAPILLLLFPLLSFSILCRTGVDHLGGPVADCGKGRHQCLNTTSSLGQTVYSCDFGGICDSILNLRDECVRDGERMVCCCSTFNGCNFGPGGPLLFARNQSKIFGAKDLNAAALKSSTALDFLKKLETGSDF